MGISHVTDKGIIAIESSYGSLPGTFTALDFGLLQRVSISEDEDVEQIGAIGGGHTLVRNERKLYLVNGSLDTYATKSALPNIMKAYLGTYNGSTDYTATSSTTINSYSMKVEYTPTTILQILGVVFTTFRLEIAKDGIMMISMDYVGKVLSEETATISQSNNSENTFLGLDSVATWGGTEYVIQNLSIDSAWNIDGREGRGIETVDAGERRLIQRVVKHHISVSGSFDAEIEASALVGYADEPTDSDFVVTVSRGTDNAHVFTCSDSALTTKDLEVNVENGLKIVTGNFVGLDLGVTGDL